VHRRSCVTTNDRHPGTNLPTCDDTCDHVRVRDREALYDIWRVALKQERRPIRWIPAFTALILASRRRDAWHGGAEPRSRNVLPQNRKAFPLRLSCTALKGIQP